MGKLLGHTCGRTLKPIQLSQLLYQEPCSTLVHEIFIHVKQVDRVRVIAEKLAVLLPNNAKFYELSVQLIEARPKFLSHQGDVLATDFIHGPSNHWCAPQLPSSPARGSGHTTYPQSTAWWTPP